MQLSGQENDRFCTFAREPERRKVGADARISVQGTAYEVDPELAGETVLLQLLMVLIKSLLLLVLIKFMEI